MQCEGSPAESGIRETVRWDFFVLILRQLLRAMPTREWRELLRKTRSSTRDWSSQRFQNRTRKKGKKLQICK